MIICYWIIFCVCRAEISRTFLQQASDSFSCKYCGIQKMDKKWSCDEWFCSICLLDPVAGLSSLQIASIIVGLNPILLIVIAKIWNPIQFSFIGFSRLFGWCYAWNILASIKSKSKFFINHFEVDNSNASMVTKCGCHGSD